MNKKVTPILIVILVGVVAFAGWFFYEQNNNIKQTGVSRPLNSTPIASSSSAHVSSPISPPAPINNHSPAPIVNATSKNSDIRIFYGIVSGLHPQTNSYDVSIVFASQGSETGTITVNDLVSNSTLEVGNEYYFYTSYNIHTNEYNATIVKSLPRGDF